MIISNDGKLEPLTLDPADYGIPACTPEDLAVSSRDGAVAVLRELLAGRGPEAMRNMLALNVGMSIYLLEGKTALATCIAKSPRSPRFRRGREGAPCCLRNSKRRNSLKYRHSASSNTSICCRFRFGSSVRPFWIVLRAKRKPTYVIAEFKRASPSRGDILMDFHWKRPQHKRAGASCLSC